MYFNGAAPAWWVLKMHRSAYIIIDLLQDCVEIQVWNITSQYSSLPTPH